MEPDTKPNWCSANFAYNWDAWLNYTYPFRWFGGAGGGPPTAQGLQHRLCGLHQRRGGGWRGAPPGGGRLEQPPNTTVSGCQITGETKNEKIIKKSIPLAHCLHSTHVSCCNYFLFLYTFHCFLYEKKINMLFSFFFLFISCYLCCFFFPLPHPRKLFPFSFASSPLHLLLKKRAPFPEKKKKRNTRNILVSLVVWEQTPASKKKRKKQQQHQSLLPFFSLMTWTVVDFDNNLCLVSVPYLSFTFPKHGRHIREYTDTHSSRGGCDDAAASRCLRSRRCILY